MEDVWSNCTLKKVSLEFGVGLQLFITDCVFVMMYLYGSLISPFIIVASHNHCIFFWVL